jgi:RNA polymerase sigma factor (sigma-70 family)
VTAPGDADSHVHDAHLVARCLQGDEAAWQELLVRHRPLVLAIARRSGLGPEAAEDVYQGTCVTLLERLELVRDHRSLAAWIATTAARRCWRLRRARRFDVAEQAMEAPGAPRAGSPPAPDVAFREAVERQAVADAVASMREPCRTLLRRMFVDEVPYAQLAAELGLAVGSIGVYRRRCLDRLRAQLAAAGWLPGDSDS